MLQFNEEEIDTDRLIEEVKSRPPLYNPEYNRSWKVTETLWRAVAKEVFPYIWDDLLNHKKDEASRIVRQRWINIRDCFVRSLRSESKRRKYIFHKKLLFMLPVVETRRSRKSNYLSSGERAQASKSRKQALKRYHECTDERDSESESDSSLLAEGDPIKEEHLEACGLNEDSNDCALEEMEDTQISTIRHNDGAAEGKNKFPEETLFLLSLAPKLRLLNEENKFDVEIQFLEILRDAISPTIPRKS